MGLMRAVRAERGAPAAPPPADDSALVAALASSDAAERRSAARGLVHYPQAAAALCARLREEPCASVRTTLLTSLIRLKSPDVACALLPLLRDEDVGLRNDVVEALQEMPDEVAPFIDGLLKDADSDVRILAILVISALPHEKAPKWLVQVLETDQHVNVCAAAIDCLTEIGDASAIAPLRRAARRFADAPFVQFAVELAITRIGGQ